ncbi:MAG: Helix-turn-helix domain [Acidobacteriota bacterium]|jgi:transcriptional regulator with XRE-family HTH domain|nr:Helix-turn-helix domain [Acidobacteriota bacterium]
MGSSRPQPTRLASKLCQIRASLGLTQQEIVEHLKSQKANLTVYPGNISRFEQGLREPPLLVLLAYARAAGVSIDVLVDDELELPVRLPKGTGQQRVKSTGDKGNLR